MHTEKSQFIILWLILFQIIKSKDKSLESLSHRFHANHVSILLIA